MAARLRTAWPALVTLVVCLGYVGMRLAEYGGDPAGLAELGSRDSEVEGWAKDGYDGQFAYYLALDPQPERVRWHLDVPAYRYQRILYPATARLLAFGRADLIPWALIAVNVAAHFAATWMLGAILVERGQRAVYALSFGLWMGLVAAVGTNLNEPLAFALIIGAWWARAKQCPLASALLLALSLFAKETSLLFWGAMLLDDLMRRRWRAAAALGLGGTAFAGWQLWLLSRFGSLGLGSGGAFSTPFEAVPLMGLLRVGAVSLPVLAVYLVIFGPTVLLPTAWGLVASLRSTLQRSADADSWALLSHSVAVLFLPFSTFRDPLGLLRFCDGLVLSLLLFASGRGQQRPLRYSLFWMALLVWLLNR